MSGSQNNAKKMKKNKKREEKNRKNRENAPTLDKEITKSDRSKGNFRIGIVVVITLLAAGFVFYNMR